MFSNLKLLKRQKRMTTTPSVLDSVPMGDFIETPELPHKIKLHREPVLPKLLKPLTDYGRYMVEVVLS